MFCRTLVLSATALMACVPAIASRAAEPVRGWIEVGRGGATTSFTGFVESSATMDIRYVLTAAKRGQSGQAQTSQSGRAHLMPDVRSHLSQTQLSIADGDAYCVELTIFAGDIVVSRDVIGLPRIESTPTCR